MSEPLRLPCARRVHTVDGSAVEMWKGELILHEFLPRCSLFRTPRFRCLLAMYWKSG